MKNSILIVALSLAATTLANGAPRVSEVKMVQPSDSPAVTISYELENGPAIVTLDLGADGANGWQSIGGRALTGITADSAVWRVVSGDGTHTITWRPDVAWAGNIRALRAKVTAWPLDNPPAYLVVDLVAPFARRYYPAEDLLPGGIGDWRYRAGSIVLRKIVAKGIAWTMGKDGADSQIAHTVTLGADYYMGVFPITQAQWRLVYGSNSSYYGYYGIRSLRPAEQKSYAAIRSTSYPDSPASGSYLDKLNALTGMTFDLPSEAQWEYACRAGHDTDHWGDGSEYTGDYSCVNGGKLGRYFYNGGMVPRGDGNYDTPPQNSDARYATPIVGSYKANDWGLYDMNGGVHEWCLDFWKVNYADAEGRVNTETSAFRVIKGGCWSSYAKAIAPWARTYEDPACGYYNEGFRVCCPLTPAAGSGE